MSGLCGASAMAQLVAKVPLRPSEVISSSWLLQLVLFWLVTII